MGLWGPTLEERLAGAARALDAAGAYGATEDLTNFAQARAELGRARDLAKTGRQWEARRAAVRASSYATLAQRDALVRREEQRRQAEAIVRGLEEGIEALEKLYSEVTPGLDKAKTSRLLSLMKEARQAVATLALAYEQGRYDEVIDGENEAVNALGGTRQELTAAKR